MISPITNTTWKRSAWPGLFLGPGSEWDFGVSPAAGGVERPDGETFRHRVLVIEDNEDAAEGLREYLELLGHEVCVANTGTEGLKLARQFPPTLVLCDIGLPEMDGWAVARALRGDPATAGLRMIALTGYGSDEDRKKSAAAGFEAHLTKPVDIDLLDAALARGA